VLGKNSAAGRLWQYPELVPTMFDELVIVGEQIQWLPLDGAPPPPPPGPAAIFDRSLALTGHGALSRFSQMRIGQTGASDPGSLVLELLVRAGVGEIVIVEFDHFDTGNLNRVLHSRRRDVQNKVGKAHRLAEVLNEIEMPTRIIVLEGGDVRREETALEL